jgi:hypothetical protein
VETGFDSPWIAGRCLSADTLLIQDIEGETTRRWRSVAAIPVAVNLGGCPPMSAAVITVGLPADASEYAGSSYLWVEQLAEIAARWSERLSDSVLETSGVQSEEEA